MVLQIEEARRALDVREHLGARELLPLEDLTTGDCPLELAHELLEVIFHHAVKAHDVAVEVVEHLGFGRHGTQEEERGAAGKDLDVALVGREQRNKAVG